MKWQKSEEQSVLRAVNHLMDEDWQKAQDLRLPGYSITHDKLHPSKLPYCGLRHLHDRLTQTKDYTDDTFTNQMFANIGQGVHWAYQRFMGAMGNAVANWYCKGPWNDEHPEEVIELKTYPKRPCPVCGRPYKHREVKFEDGALVGKSDFLWLARTGDDAWGNLLMVVDVKSSDDDRIAAQVEDPTIGYFPNRDHTYQIESYVPLVEDKLERKVDGWILHYVGRGKPFKNQLKIIQLVNDDDRQVFRERNQYYKDHHALSLKVDGSSDRDMDAFEELVKTKPCASQEDYTANFHNYFNPCPVRDSCFGRQRLENHFFPLLRKP